MYSSRIRAPRALFEQGKYEEAIAQLKTLSEAHDNDYLLYMLDLGTVYHTAGRYEDAIRAFIEAEKFAEIKDYTSLSQEMGSVLLNDSVKVYKGELFENVLINVYLAIDYTLLGKSEEALVECRKVNHKLDRMKSEGKLPVDHNPFAKYLAAALFESDGEYNDAFVDYRMLEKWAGGFAYLPGPLLRMAAKLKSSQEFQEYQEKYPNAKNWRLGKDYGEVVLIVEQGRVPYKIPHPGFYLLPKFTKNTYISDSVLLRDKDGSAKAQSAPLFDIEQTAIKELDDRTAGIIAKKMAGIVAKEAAGYAVEKATKSKELGALTAILLRVTDQADLRSWTTLPARLQIARLRLPVGKRDLAIDLVSQGGAVTQGIKIVSNFEVKPGRVQFLHYRTPDL